MKGRHGNASWEPVRRDLDAVRVNRVRHSFAEIIATYRLDAESARSLLEDALNGYRSNVEQWITHREPRKNRQPKADRRPDGLPNQCQDCQKPIHYRSIRCVVCARRVNAAARKEKRSKEN